MTDTRNTLSTRGEQERTHPVAQALRAAGYVPLPRLWILAEEMPQVHAIAERHRETVNEIRSRINRPEEAAS